MNPKLQKIIAEQASYAKRTGIKLNPNEKVVEGVASGLLRDLEKYGKEYCPCRRPSGNPDKDREIICPCKWHLEEIKKDGHCLCYLFVDDTTGK